MGGVELFKIIFLEHLKGKRFIDLDLIPKLKKDLTELDMRPSKIGKLGNLITTVGLQASSEKRLVSEYCSVKMENVNKMPFIVALIPAYNESMSIGDVIKEVSSYVDKVVVIDDSSSDQTAFIARYLGAEVLNHFRNMGVGAAMRTGINYVKTIKPDIVVTLDGDGQHKPEDIPRIIQPILSGSADLVLGSRFLQGTPEMPLIKLFGNKFFAFLIRILVGVRLTDTQTGFRALSQKALMSLDLKANYTYVQEMIIDLYVKSFQIVEVPIRVLPRKYGHSKVALNIFNYAIRALTIIAYAYLQKIKHLRNDVKGH